MHDSPSTDPAAAPSVAVTPSRISHYDRLGGQVAIVRLVDAFYAAMDTRPEAAVIRAMHEPDLRETRAVLVSYLSEWMGGPKTYTPARGAPMLRRRHQAFRLDTAARDAWMLCMRQALQQVCLDDGLRQELDAAFYKVADFIRNTDEDGSARSHPGRPRDGVPVVIAMPAAVRS